ncbi:RNA-directed DNA polymerase from mobile element jockey [Paramuricea clavata]|uniref:RNA-directed DNA polymerase from mobile element jockey n=1 Tax=Paramuricea clavata TaxID=317549 RepID=A0A7D9L7P5_PARCT|nr:RNA-directed DNA polymerase from mobile element jockey [Paramuricea clavata]
MELLLNVNSSTYRIVVIYRPPLSSLNKVTYSAFLEEFTKLLEHISLASGKLIIVGDFNCHVDKGGSNALRFLELLQIFNLEQHVNVLTHSSGHTLYLIITRKDETMINNLKLFDAVISDHFVLHCNLDLAKPCNVKSDISYRKLGDIDTLKFRENILSSELYTRTAPTLEERFDQYDLVLSTLLENHARLRKKTVTIRSMAPWYNEDIKKQKIVRRCKERRWRKSGSQVDRQAYADQCILVKNTISEAKMEYYSSLVQDADKIFKIKQGLQTLLSENTRVFSHLDNPKLTFCLDEFIYTTTEELSDILEKTKLKSCVLYPIPAKKAASYPTLKKSVTDYEEFSNFRPISNLKFISKMTEKVVSLRLLHYLRSNGLEELYQSAYKQFHSCETALYITKIWSGHDCGVADQSLRERLLRDADLTLAKVVDASIGAEERHAKELEKNQQSSDIHQVYHLKEKKLKESSKALDDVIKKLNHTKSDWSATLCLNGTDVNFNIDIGTQWIAIQKRLLSNLSPRPKIKTAKVPLSVYNDTNIPVADMTTDYFSKYIEIERLTDRSSATVVNKIKKVFTRHGISKEFCSDNGPEYTAACFKQLSKNGTLNTLLQVLTFRSPMVSSKEES